MLPRNLDYKNYLKLLEKRRARKKQDLFAITGLGVFICLFIFLIYLGTKNGFYLVSRKGSTAASKKHLNNEVRKTEVAPQKKQELVAHKKHLQEISSILKMAREYKEKGEKYEQQKLSSEAKKFFQKSLDFYLKLKNYKIEELKECGLEESEYFYNIANLLFLLGKVKEAEKIIVKFVDKVEDKRYYISAGSIMFKLQEYGKAEEYFNKALKLDPQNELIYYYLGIVALEKKNYKDAIKNFEKAISLGYKKNSIRAKLGQLYNLIGDYKKAYENYLLALQDEPRDWKLYNVLGILSYQNGNFDEAEDWYKKSLQIAPSPEVYYNLGILEYERGNYEEARNYFEKILKEYPSFFSLSEVKEKLKELEKIRNSEQSPKNTD